MMRLLFLPGLFVYSRAFVPGTRPTHSSHWSRQLAENDDDRKDSSSSSSLFESEGWKPIQQDLDQVPVFTVATAEGHPLAYQLDVKGKSYTVPFFYTDVDAALAELKASRQNTQLDGIDLIPFPLGKAFALWAKDEAVIVPAQEAILQAGAPPNAKPIGQQVPCFCCLEIAEEGADGKPRLPLFLDLADANAALQQAVQADGGKLEDFEVVCLSLNRAVDQLVESPETSAFRFLPPSKSMKYIEEYLS